MYIILPTIWTGRWGGETISHRSIILPIRQLNCTANAGFCHCFGVSFSPSTSSPAKRWESTQVTESHNYRITSPISNEIHLLTGVLLTSLQLPLCRSTRTSSITQSTKISVWEVSWRNNLSALESETISKAQKCYIVYSHFVTILSFISISIGEKYVSKVS